MPLRASANLWGHLFLQIRNLVGFMGLSRFIYKFANIHCCQQTTAAGIPSFPGNEEDTLSDRAAALICGLLYSNVTGVYL